MCYEFTNTGVETGKPKINVVCKKRAPLCFKFFLLESQELKFPVDMTFSLRLTKFHGIKPSKGTDYTDHIPSGTEAKFFVCLCMWVVHRDFWGLFVCF